MTDTLDDLAWHDRDNRPVADPSRYFDYADKRLKLRLCRMQARETLAELVAAGITLSVRKGVLYAGPPEQVVNGTKAKIERYKLWLVEMLQEES